MSLLDVTTTERDGAVHIALVGELDISSATRVEDELRRVEEERPPVILVDLKGLEFMDSTGLRVLTSADTRARKDGRRLAIGRGPESVQRIFRMTKLDDRLDIVESEVAG